MKLTRMPTLLSPDRLANLIKFSARALPTPGDFAEFGVYKGGSLELMAKCHPHRVMFGIDSFAGLPAEGEKDFHREGDFSDVDYHAMAGYFKIRHPNVRLLRGFSPKVFEFFESGHQFAFVHVDVDLHQSVLDACDFFWPRMSPGGIMLFDDYGFAGTRGATVAIKEFFAKRGGWPVVDPDGNSNHQYMAVK